MALYRILGPCSAGREGEVVDLDPKAAAKVAKQSPGALAVVFPEQKKGKD